MHKRIHIILAELREVPDLANHIVLPAILGNSLWTLYNVLFVGEVPAAGWRAAAIGVTLLYLLGAYAEVHREERWDRRSRFDKQLSFVGSLLELGALAVFVIALGVIDGIRVACFALAVFGVVVGLRHYGRLLHYKNQRRRLGEVEAPSPAQQQRLEDARAFLGQRDRFEWLMNLCWVQGVLAAILAYETTWGDGDASDPLFAFLLFVAFAVCFAANLASPAHEA